MLKKNLLLLLSVFTLLPTLSAQHKAREVQASFSQGSGNALQLEIDGLEAGEVEKLWSKFLKDYDGKPKKVKKGDELMADDVTIKRMSNNTVDIYSLASKRGDDGALFTVWFDLGGAYLSSSMHPDGFPEARQMMDRFALLCEQEKVEVQLKTEEGELKDLEKDLTRLEKDQKGYEKDIEDYRKKIEEAEAAIQESIRQQETKKVEIQTQQGQIEGTRKLLKKLGKG